MNPLLSDAAWRANAYLAGLDSRPVAPRPEDIAGLSQLDIPLPELPSDPAFTLKLLDEVCSPATVATAGGRFFGFVIGGSLPVTLAANWLAGAWDQNSALYNVTPATTQLEQYALRWLYELFGLPSCCGGAFVTGGTMANFTALAAARHTVLARAGWDVEADGLIGAPPLTVVVGAEVHPTLLK
ncbi:MAG: pyridoxal-dependent decarboxylase, partial [Anaerolineae bacterium]